MPGEPGLLLATEISRQNVAKEGWTTYYVSKDGNDGANGLKWESAFLTIQRAIDISESWAKIYVKAGTYAENVLIAAGKDSIELIGEHVDAVIIKPASSNPLKVEGDNCYVSSLTAYSQQAGQEGIKVKGTKNVFDNISLEGIAGAQGFLFSSSNRSILKNSYISDSNITRGIVISGDAELCEIHNNYIKLPSATTTITLHGTKKGKIYENDIVDAAQGTLGIAGSSGYSIYHNNFVNCTTNVLDYGDNNWFENFYDDHIVDTNNDGLCDSPYTFTTGVDYSPVSKRNGWLQQSIGFGEGGGGDYQGDIEIWDSFEYVSDAALQTKWIEGGFAGNPTRSLTAYEGQYSMQTVIGAGGVGHVYRLLTSRNMKTLANIGIASQSDVGGDTFQFTLYDSAGNYSYWTQTCNAAPDTWTYHNVNPHSVPTGASATPVDLEDIVEIRMANLTASSIYKFDFIKFESLTASKIGIGYDGLDDALETTSSVRGHLLDIADDYLKYLTTSALGAHTAYSIADILKISATEKIKNFIAKAGGDEIPAGEAVYNSIKHIVNTAVTGAGVANSIVDKLDLGAGYKPASDQYYTATRGPYLDNINQAGLLQITAARAGYLDEINAAALAQGAGSVASNAEVDSLVRAITDIIRAGGSGDLAAALSQKIEVQEVVIYPVSEHAGATKITDDGSSPAYYADTECGVATLEANPNVHWLEDINFENNGTITVISMFLEFEWQHKTAGGTAYSKIQMSGDGGATWIDLTDSIAEADAAYQIKKRMGVGNFVATITAGVNQLQVRLVSWEAAGNSSCCKIRSNSYVRITYRKS